MKQRTDLLRVSALVLAALFSAAAVACTNSNGPAQLSQGAMPADVLAAANAPFGSEGEAIAYGDFAAAGGVQVLVVHKLSAQPQPAGQTTASAQKPETALDVLRVSVLSREGGSWKEAFRADGHLKNRRGYLDASAVTVPSWRLSYEKTADSGFRLDFTALNLPSGMRPMNVRVAWNPKQKEYDSLDASGMGFLRPSSSPGGGPLRWDR